MLTIETKELNIKCQEQKQYENLSFTVDDLLIIQDKQQIDEFMNPYLFFININKWLETPREKEINNYIYEQNYGYDKDFDDRDIDI